MNSKIISIIKILILLLVAAYGILEKPANIGPDVPPLFVFPIVFIVSFFLSLLFFKGISRNNKLTSARLSTFSFNFFYDPLPVFHFCALYALVKGIFEILNSLIYSKQINPVSFFALTIGSALFLSVTIASNKFIKD